MSIARCRTVVGSLYGLMRNALGINVATSLESQELSCTVAPDRRLVVLGHEPIAGFARDHGTVADEAAMLALHTLDGATLLAEPTFVAPGDSCLRADDPGWRWYCITNHGQALADWERRPLGGALEDLATSGHTHAISAITGLQTDLDNLDIAIAGKQATLANAAALARITAADDLPRWDGAVWPGGGGGGWTVASTPPQADYACAWVSNGDSNGILYCLGSALRTGSWSNPHTSGAVIVTPSTTPLLATRVCDRSYNSGESTENYENSHVQIDFWAARAQISRYTIQNRSIGGGSHMIVNWTLEASIDGTVWTALHTGAGTPSGWSSGAWAGYAVADTTFWRYIRWRQVGANSSGAYYFCPGEIELYGTLRTGRLLPAGAVGWMRDGDGHYIAYYD